MKVEIHVIGGKENEKKAIIEKIHGKLITCGLVASPTINYGLTQKDRRKYVSFDVTDKVLDFISNVTSSAVGPEPTRAGIEGGRESS